jgi:hypothetical protein
MLRLMDGPAQSPPPLTSSVILFLSIRFAPVSLVFSSVHHHGTTTMPASFVGAGVRGAQALAVAWCSRRHMPTRPEFLALGLAARALEHAREAGAAITTTTGLRADLACSAGPPAPHLIS